MISIREILENVKDDPMLKDLSFERALRYTKRLIRLIGVPKFYETVTELVEVHNYKCLVPCDCIRIIQIRNPHTMLCLRQAMETFHKVPGSASFETYDKQGDILFFSFEEGEVEIAYDKMFVDEEGFPLIEDNEAFMNALELYIKKEYFTVLFNNSKLDYRILQNIQREYAVAASQATHSLTNPSKDEIQNVINILNTPTLANNIAKHGFGRKIFNEKFAGQPVFEQADIRDIFGSEKTF